MPTVKSMQTGIERMLKEMCPPQIPELVGRVLICTAPVIMNNGAVTTTKDSRYPILEASMMVNSSAVNVTIMDDNNDYHDFHFDKEHLLAGKPTKWFILKQ